jgi:N-carbamoylputrescine amidase
MPSAMTMPRKYNVGLVQMNMGPDPEANFASAVNHIREAARLGANIVCLPELFRTQYFCQRQDQQLFDQAEAIPGPSTQRLGELARELHVSIVASLFERRAAGLYHNTAVTLNAEGNVAGVYRKMHIPDDPLYFEKYYFTPGDLGFQALDLDVGRVGTLVSRRCSSNRTPRCRSFVLSHRHRLASGGKRAVWGCAVRGMANYSTRARHC